MNIKQFFKWRAAGTIIVLVIIGIVLAFYQLNNYIYQEKQGYTSADYKNAEFIIDGNRIRLISGSAETDILGTATKIRTDFFGNEVTTDLNSDGREDVVFLLTQQNSGSGTFYYVVAAVNTERGYVGSEAYLLGDRIAPQTTEKQNGGIVLINYAERAPGEPFTTSPSVGKSVWLKFDTTAVRFEILPQNVDDESATLGLLIGKTWVWERALYNDEREVTPKTAGAFLLNFENNGQFSAATDCNSMGGNYLVEGDNITLSDMATTLMSCEGSQEGEFTALLQNSKGYHFGLSGELILSLKFDSGTAVFVPK